MSVLLLLQTAAIIDPDAYSPLLPIPNLRHANGSSTLPVSPALRFALGQNASRSTVLVGGLARYRTIMFAWGTNTTSRLSGATLTAVEIEVGDPDDRAI